MSGATELLDLGTIRIDARLARRVPAAIAVRRHALVFGEDAAAAYAAVADIGDEKLIEALERALGKEVHALAAEPSALQALIERVYQRHTDGAGDDAVRLVNELLHGAVVELASDLHLEPLATGLRVRMRVDGELETLKRIEPTLAPSVINRIKVLAGLDIAERRLPQDGSFRWHYGRGDNEHGVDVRVATMPVRFGERMTLRLLALDAERLTLEHLGLEHADLTCVREVVDGPHGMILLTGPTGSGKSTTLYALLRTLDLATTNLLTVEDPIEYELAGASQIEIDTDDRVTFARALRGLLRHDPDVLMIGEIRDRETADIAIKAALTGHQLYSTLHTASAAGAVTRLIDMGMPAYLVAATVRLVIAQRLVRKLCQRCARERGLAAHEAAALGAPQLAGSNVRDPGGCGFCKRTGFAGRLGLFERLLVDADVAAAITRGATEPELFELARVRGARSLREDALAKVLVGLTSPGEALRSVEAAL